MDHSKDLILLLPVVVSTFWFVTILLTSYENKWRKFALLFFMASVVVTIFSTFLFFIGNYVLYEKLYVISIFFAFSQFPAFYNYVVSLLTEKTIPYSFYLKHWIIPILLTLVGWFIMSRIMSGKEKIYFVEEVLTGKAAIVGKFKYAYTIDKMFKAIFILSAFFYFHLINKRVNNHEEQILDYFSNTEDVSFKWFKFFKVVFFAAFIFAVFFNVLDKSFHVNNIWLTIISFSLFATFYWVVGYLGHKQIDIYEVSIKEDDVINRALLEVSDEEIILDKNKANGILKSVDAIIKHKKLFLNKNLTLVDLVLTTRIDRNIIMYVINKYLNLNFNDYINKKRIEYAKHILSSNEIVSVDNLYKECGFKSLSKFKDAFIQFTGEKPIEYRKKFLLSNLAIS